MRDVPADDDSPVDPTQWRRRRRKPWMLKAALTTLSVLVFLGIAAAIIGGIREGGLARDLEVRPAGSGNFLIACEVTGRGEPKADESFSERYVEGLAARGIRLDRQYYGTRVRLTAEVTRPTSQTGYGTYTVYGTVKDIDLIDHRMRLTDCVLVPVK